ncbi:MAG: hypothetical protein ACJ71N_05570, partial [Terriglobales bacterium]
SSLHAFSERRPEKEDSPMVERILQLLSVKCAHRRTSQPFTASATQASVAAQWESVTSASHYVVCLECGKKFTYDWSQMRIVR